MDHLHRCKTSFGCSRFSCFNIRFAGGTGPLWIPVPTKLFHNGEAEIDHLRVPAPIFLFVNGDRLSQVPACRLVFPISIMDYAASEPSSELRCQQVSIHCTVFAI